MNPQLSVALTLSDKFLFQQMETITEKSQQAVMFSDWGRGVQPVWPPFPNKPINSESSQIKSGKQKWANKNKG